MAGTVLAWVEYRAIAVSSFAGRAWWFDRDGYYPPVFLI